MSGKQNRSLSRSSAIIMVARIIAYVCTMLLPIVLTRVLTLHDLGIYKQVFVAVNSLMGILPLGFFMSAYYYIPRFPERRGAAAGHIFVFTVGMGLAGTAVVTLFPGFLEWAFHEPALRGYAPAIGFTALLWMAGNVMEAITLANSEVNLSATVIFASQFFRTALLLAAAWLVQSVQALLVAALIQGLLQMGLLVWYLRSRFPGFWRHLSLSGFEGQLKYSLPYGMGGLAYTMVTDLHNYFVSRTYGAETFALYSTGCFQLPLMSVLGESVTAVLLPRVSQLQSEGRHEEIVQSVSRAIRKLALVYFPVFFFLEVVARDLILMLFKDTFLASVPIFRVNLALVLLNLFVLDPISRAYPQFRIRMLGLNVALAVLMVVSLALGVGPFGPIGAIAIVVGVLLLGRLSTLYILRDALHLRWSHLRLLRGTGLAAVAGAAAMLGAIVVHHWLGDSVPGFIAASAYAGRLAALMRMLVTGVVYCLGYGAALFALRVIEPDEISLLRRWTRLPAAQPKQA
jgi:O-antigen/teichoic acid export membrane protein